MNNGQQGGRGMNDGQQGGCGMNDGQQGGQGKQRQGSRGGHLEQKLNKGCEQLLLNDGQQGGRGMNAAAGVGIWNKS